jgi:hypothetical protein
MSTVLPIVLWYGGLLGVILAALLVLWALALYALKQATGFFAPGILVAGVALAALSSWALTSSIGLNQENQLVKVREPLMRFVAGSVLTRSAIEDVGAAAEPSSDLTALQAKYDVHQMSLENLLQAEWQYQRGRPWNERALLHKTTWDLQDLRVHHAQWEKGAKGLDCPAPAVPSLSQTLERLQQRLQNQQVLAMAIGEQFEGFDLNEPQSQAVSDTTTARVLASSLVVLALLAVVAVVAVRRKRPAQAVDALVIVSALVLAGVAVWLTFRTGADQERLRADLFDRVATIYRETVDLNTSVKMLMLSPRTGVLQPRDTRERIIADYHEYGNAMSGLAQLVRIWGRAVLTGTLDTGLVSSERIATHDDLVNAIRSRTLSVYRQYVNLDGRIGDLSCRSLWFARNGNQALEDELVKLP